MNAATHDFANPCRNFSLTWRNDNFFVRRAKQSEYFIALYRDFNTLFLRHGTRESGSSSMAILEGLGVGGVAILLPPHSSPVHNITHVGSDHDIQ